MNLKNNMDLTLSIFAAAAVLLGTGLGFYLNYKSQSETKDKQYEIEALNIEIDKKVELNNTLNGKILDLSGEVKGLSDIILKITQSNEELAKENKKLATETLILSGTIKDIQTGGDSFCYLALLFRGDNIMELMLNHRGEFLIRSVSITLTDNHKRMKLLNEILDDNSDNISEKTNAKLINWTISNEYNRNYQIGILSPNMGKVIDRFKLKDDDKVDFSFTIHFLAENGTFFQNIRFYRNNGKTLTASEVYRGDKLIYEHTNKDFPRNEKGEPIWSAKFDK